MVRVRDRRTDGLGLLGRDQRGAPRQQPRWFEPQLLQIQRLPQQFEQELLSPEQLAQ
jgi:hypothetical protein